jgi:hypothetical protein
MQKSTSCPICKTLIQNDTNQCSNCRWIITSYSSLDRENYNRLVDWAVDCYKRVDEYKSRSDWNKQTVEDRLNRQRDEIDSLRKKVDLILQRMPEENCNSIASTSTQSIIDEELRESHNYEPATPMKEICGTSQGHIDREYSISSTKKVDRDDDFQQAEHSQLTQVHQQIINDYSRNSGDFERNYISKIATITKDTINSIWRSENKVVILTEADSGNYWIIECESICYLVPFYPLSYVNQNSYKIFNMIFECENYTPDYQGIQLIEAAIVTKEDNSNSRTWRLQQQGKLVFT